MTSAAGASTEARLESLRTGPGGEYARYEAERRGNVEAQVNTPEQTQLLEGLAGMPRKTAQEIEDAQQRLRQTLRPEMVETNEAALRRSFEAESALQAEVTLLRERTGQLQAQLDEQRQTLVAGVQQMLAPLREYFSGAGHEVPVAEMIPQAVERLRALAQTVAQVQAEAKTLRRPVEVRRVAPDVREMQSLERLVARMADTLRALDARLSRLEEAGQADSDEPQPESLGTFVMSDRTSAEIERALLDAQARGRSFPG